MPTFSNPDDAPDELTRLLLTAVPANEHGHKTLTHLSKLLGCNRWSMRKWILAQKLAPEWVVKIVDLSEGRVSLSDFSRFVYTL